MRVRRPTGAPTASPVSSGGENGWLSSPTSCPAVIRAAAVVQSLSRSRRSDRLVPETTFMVPKASRSWAGVAMPAWWVP